MFSKKVSSSAGFSFVEMAMVLGVVSLVTILLIPKYNEFKLKAQIVEVVQAFATIQKHMEIYYQINQTYVNDSPEPSSSTCGAINIAALKSKYFEFQCVSVDLDKYLWVASNKASVGLGEANTFKYTINENGEKTTTAFPDVEDVAPCWLLYNNAC